MIKLLMLASLVGIGTLSAPESVSIRLAGESAAIRGVVVDGKDYAPVEELAGKLGAKTAVDHLPSGGRQIILTPGVAAAKGFDESAETAISLADDTKTWHTIDGSHGHLRVRDFVKGSGSDAWKLTGELEVAPESILLDGRIPRGRVNLQFYVTCRNGDGKTVSRYMQNVQNVAYDGGRYPITVNGYYGANILPATITLRFNAADEYIPPEPAGGGTK